MKTQQIPIFRATTVLLIFILFTVGSVPIIGKSFSGKLHILIHIAAYALIAVSVGLSWKNMQTIHIFAIVTTIGIFHEMTEIISHSHPFEFKDVIINGFGASVGAAILFGFQKFRQKDISEQHDFTGTSD